MPYLLTKERKTSRLMPVRIIPDPKLAQSLLHPMRWKIFSELCKGEKCAHDLAKAFNSSEQAICYHLKELEKNRLVKLHRTEKRRGAVAKYYKGDPKAIAVLPYEFQGGQLRHDAESVVETSSRLIGPFVAKGQFNGCIVIGSPDPHGIFRSRARCGDRAIDLALFLGSLLPITRESVVRLDTEISQQELAQNLLTVGGPKVNTVTFTMNEYLPITYELTGHSMMISRISGKSYAGEDEGAIQMVVNPYNSDSRVIVIAGNSYLGTRAAVLAFIRYTSEIADGNSLNNSIVARVVSGLDVNSDGLVDDVEFLE